MAISGFDPSRDAASGAGIESCPPEHSDLRHEKSHPTRICAVFSVGPLEMPSWKYKPWGPADHIVGELARDPTPGRLDTLLARLSAGYHALDWKTSRGSSCLAVAISKKAVPLIERILELRPDLINESSYTQNSSVLIKTPYVVQAAVDPRIIQLFIDRGAKLNLADDFARTPLFVSAEKSENQNTTELIIRNGGCAYHPRTVYRDSVNLTGPMTLSVETVEIVRNNILRVRDSALLEPTRFLHGAFPTDHTLPSHIRKKIFEYATGIHVSGPVGFAVGFDIECDAGWGNSLEIRGIKGDWDASEKLICVGPSRWRGEFVLAKDSEFKIVRKLSDGTIQWEKGDNRSTRGPSKFEFTPLFE